MDDGREKSKLSMAMYWLSFEFLAVVVPVVVMMAIHFFLLHDFALINYAEDILLLAISISTNVLAESLRAKDRILECFFWLIMIVDMLILIFLAATYCTFYTIPTVPNTFDKLFISRFCVCYIIINLFVGIILSLFED